MRPKMRVQNAPACQTRAESKVINMYELAYCRPIVVILVLVLIAFYCIRV